MVAAFPSRAADTRFDSRLPGDLSGSSHAADLIIGTAVATLPGARCNRFSARTGWPGVTGWDRKFDLQLLSQCGSTYTCRSRFVSEIH